MNFVQPIKEKKDIYAMKAQLKKGNIKYYTLFVIGINSLLRVSDLLNLQLSDMIYPDGTLKEKIIMREQKTNKKKEFPFNSSIVEALTEYLKYHNHKDSCLFPSRKWFNQEDYINRKMVVDHLNPHIKNLISHIEKYKSIRQIADEQHIDLAPLIQDFTVLLFEKIDKEVEDETDEKKRLSKYNRGKKIKDSTPETIEFLLNVEGHDPVRRGRIHNIIKEASIKVGIKDNISTHSMRKTAAYNFWVSNPDDPKIIDYLQYMLNHASRDMVFKYLGITKDIINNIYMNNPL